MLHVVKAHAIGSDLGYYGLGLVRLQRFKRKKSPLLKVLQLLDTAKSQPSYNHWLFILHENRIVSVGHCARRQDHAMEKSSELGQVFFPTTSHNRCPNMAGCYWGGRLVYDLCTERAEISEWHSEWLLYLRGPPDHPLCEFSRNAGTRSPERCCINHRNIL